MSLAATRMDLESVILSDVSQTEKEKYCLVSYMWNVKRNDSNELKYNRGTDAQRKKDAYPLFYIQ